MALWLFNMLEFIGSIYLSSWRWNAIVNSLSAWSLLSNSVPNVTANCSLWSSTIVDCSLCCTSAKNISVRAEWLSQSGHAPSEPSETPQWRIIPRPASITRVTLHITLRSLFRPFFSLCRSPILNKHSGVVANCDHTSEWVHWVHACIGIAMQWVTLRQSLLSFLLH